MVAELPQPLGRSLRVPAGCPPELGQKLARLQALARVHGVTTLVLREPATLAWLFNARVHVPQTLDNACLDVVLDVAEAPRLTIVANAIEAPRLRAGELAGVPAQWTVLPWWEDRTAHLPDGADVGSDRPLGRTVAVGPAITEQRRILTDHQQSLLRAVAGDCAEGAGAAARYLDPSMSEYAAAAVLAEELLQRALDPVVLMVAGEEHVAAHRHPLPTTAPLGSRAVLVACGRRHGLIASVTRIVSFARLSATDRQAYENLLRVEAAFLNASTPGARLGDIVTAGTDAYATHGFDGHEWHRHHQGGLSGFTPREFPAHTSSTTLLVPGNVVAWNPSGRGWKVEDTALITPEGPELLVRDENWPMLSVAGRFRPDVLVRVR